MKHTPGPWMKMPLEDDFPGIGASGLKNWRLVGANRISPGIVFGGLGEETDANARLIAAAPELLEAAREMLNRHDAEAVRANFTRCGCDNCVPFRAVLDKIDRAQ